jgi:uncharacterized protein (TIGR00725 family)
MTLALPILAPKTVGVMGSGIDEYPGIAHEVGALLARLGVNLLTGGGGGVMRSVSRAFTQANRTRGICIGIIPCFSERDRLRPKVGYPNEFVELAIYTHLPLSGERGTEDLSRNHINVLSCCAIVALPGGPGTASEVSLARGYGKPVIIYAPVEGSRHGGPASVPIATSLDHVERFLMEYVAI